MGCQEIDGYWLQDMSGVGRHRRCHRRRQPVDASVRRNGGRPPGVTLFYSTVFCKAGQQPKREGIISHRLKPPPADSVHGRGGDMSSVREGGAEEGSHQLNARWPARRRRRWLAKPAAATRTRVFPHHGRARRDAVQ